VSVVEQMDDTTSDEITAHFLIVLQRHLDFSDKHRAFPMHTNLEELGLDSLRAIDLLLDLEDTFNITFPDLMLSEEVFRTAKTLMNALCILLER
jgi:acyl carrier protein